MPPKCRRLKVEENPRKKKKKRMGSDRHDSFPPTIFLVFLLLLPSVSSYSVNPFSPKASLLRQWSRLFPTVDIPDILLAKSSPLNATQLAAFSTFVDSHTIHHYLPSFCSAANLFCDVKVSSTNDTHDLKTDADFSNYNNNNFKRYQVGGPESIGDTFTNYSVEANVARDTFLRYGQDGSSQIDRFSNYEQHTNVAESRFKNYDQDANGGISNFINYSNRSNVQKQEFTNYGKGSSGTDPSFESYSENSNVVKNDFSNYIADSSGGFLTFGAYSTSSNVLMNKFNSYDDDGNAAFSQFNNYAEQTNIATNEFKSYDDGGANGALSQFNNYADNGNIASNKFESYSNDGNGGLQQFTNYGNETSQPQTDFKIYGKEGNGVSEMFTGYFQNATTFSKYFDSSPSFDEYRNSSISASKAQKSVEAGKFFRRETLVTGNQIPFPDVRDKMPPRSFLPRPLAEKFPFNTANIPQLVQVFGDGSMRTAIGHTLSECERPAAKDETKRCVTSIEGMAEFASSMLGKNARVSATESTVGWGQKLKVGKVEERNGGKETRSVSCHQSLFPYLVYYCHMVPRVRVYDVELLVGGEPVKTNRAVAICHMDTTQWSPGHAAFLALGPAPGKIEVCHFIFENDLIWVARD